MDAAMAVPRPRYRPVTVADRLEWVLDEVLSFDLDEEFGDDEGRLEAEVAALAIPTSAIHAHHRASRTATDRQRPEATRRVTES